MKKFKNLKGRGASRILAFMLSICMVFSCIIPGITMTAYAENGNALSHDPVTIEDWKKFFPADSTENAGGVWTDKSVVSGDGEGNQLRGQKAEEDEFLVGLSAVGSSLRLHTGAATPTDTVLVLDSSSSMNSYRSELNWAVNEVIDKLMLLNENNRVAIVFYSSNATTLLPLGHYKQTATSGITYDNKYISFTNGRNGGNDRYSVSDTLTKDGVPYDGGSMETISGTNQQLGMITAMNILNAATDEEKANNIPVMVLMSDGEATVANTDYTDSAGGTHLCTYEGENRPSTEELAFFTQLGASYARNQVDDAYDKPVHIYTLGFNIDNPSAQLLLNPEKYKSNPNGDDEITEILGFWEKYDDTGNGDTVRIDKFRVDKVDSHKLEMNYVDAGGAFEATTDSSGNTGLIATFDKIFEKIEAVSDLEYVTQVTSVGADLSGYVSFVDHIGKYMKVDEIRGVMLNGEMYTGADFASGFFGAGDSGTPVFGSSDEPTLLGDEFVRSIRARLGLAYDNIGDGNDRTHALIRNAYECGQLSYTNDDIFSNYFGWYSDANYNCIAPWNDKTDPNGTKTDFSDVAALGYPGDAAKPKYVNKSYLFLGKDHDAGTMYMSVRVSRDISSEETAGEETVAFGIPASLLPVIKYIVNDEKDAETGESINVTMEYNTGNVTPTTLFYEVKPGVNSDTLPLIKAEYKTANKDGSDIKFYTNQWVKEFETSLDVTRKIDPATVKENTYSYFEPNKANRKYYFDKEEYVYHKVGEEYEIYDGAVDWVTGSAADKDYYYMQEVYVVKDGKASMEKKYFPLNNHTLLGGHSDTAGLHAVSKYAATQEEGTGKWYVPKGAIHRHMSRFLVPKGSGTTGTLANTNIPFVEDKSLEDNTIYACAVLGNNGLAKVADKGTATGTESGGILLSKELADGITDTTTKFAFTLTATNEAFANLERSVYSYKLSNGVPVTEKIGTITFGADKKATVELAAGDVVYIADLPAGTATDTITIEENDNVQYKPKTVKVGEVFAGNPATPATVKITAGGYENVEYVNERKTADDTDERRIAIHYLDESYDTQVTYDTKLNVVWTEPSKTEVINALKEPHKHQVNESDDHLINIGQHIDPTITHPETGKNYVLVKTEWLHGQDGADPIVIFNYYALDELDDPDNNEEDGDGIPDKYQATVKFKAKENGTVSGTTTQVFTLYDADKKYADKGKVSPKIHNGIVTATPEDNYAFDCWTYEDGTDPVDPETHLNDTVLNAGDVVWFYANFAEDKESEINPHGDDGDDIPDKYQAIVKFESAGHGKVTGNGIKQVFTLRDKDGNPIKTAVVKPSLDYVETDPDSGYKFNKWTKDNDDANPTDDLTINAGETIVFKAHFKSTGGGSSNTPNRPSRPSTTTTTRKDLLNTGDHFAYIIGYPDGDVRPEAQITRAEIATIFYRMLTDDARDEYLKKENPFPDVNVGNWYNNAISTLANADILHGYNDGSFRPDDAITRAELSKIAASFYDTVANKDSGFTDIEGHWAEAFIEAAYAYGFIDGYPDKTFKPDQYITRAEAMKLVNRTLGRKPDKDKLLDDMIKWPDNADVNEWYYADVQEATNSHYYMMYKEFEEWTELREVRDWKALEDGI